MHVVLAIAWMIAGMLAALLNKIRKPEEDMGFRPEEVQYNLKWEEGHELHGLEIRIGSVTVRKYNEMMKQGLKTGEEGIEANEWIIALLVEKIIRWNLENSSGETMPVSMESMEELDRRHLNMISRAWQFAIAGVSDQLGKASSNGASSLEESLGLASSSESPLN